MRPPATVDHDLATGAETTVHVQAVTRSLDGYRCEVVHAVADDGVAVPVTLIRRGDDADARDAGPGPCLLYGYGAYESSLDPEFWAELLPLLDRGVTLALAHVRGGGELGRDWWQQGRLLRKRTTFTDFVACARHLVATGVTTPRPARRARHQRRRPADGRRRAPGSRGLRADRRGGAVRRRGRARCSTTRCR